MAYLNDKNKITEKKIHLLVTTLCDRCCPDCCNNQYNMDLIPFVTEEELKNAEEVFLTGGEPFAYSKPDEIAAKLKAKYPNIKRVFAYTNAIELGDYLSRAHNNLWHLDGLTVSIKNKMDYLVFERDIIYDRRVCMLNSNIVYTFSDDVPGCDNLLLGNFIKKDRHWQKDFTPAPDSIFRRL